MLFCPKCKNSLDITNVSSQKGGSPDEDQLQVGGADIKAVIENLLEGDNVSESDVKGIDLEKLNKAPSYKKLPAKSKELVYNTISDKQQNKKFKDVSQKGIAFFICHNCGHKHKVEEGTMVFSRNSEANISHVDREENYMDYVNDPTVNRTRRYVCHNEKCPSHKNLMMRKAVFFRVNNRIRYICTACKTSWIG